MKNRALIVAAAGFLFVAVCCAIIPIRYHYADKTVAPLPSHTMYENAVGEALPKIVVDSAAAYKCTGIVIPVSDVKGDDPALPNLGNDINLALAAYGGWKLLVDDETRQQMKSRKETLMKNWGSMISGDQLMNLALVQKDVAFKTNYSVSVVLSALAGSSLKSLDDRKLAVTVNDELKQSRIFGSVVTFVHPATLKKWQDDRSAKAKRLVELEKWADFCRKMLAALAALFVVTVIVLFMVTLVARRRDRVRKDFWLKEIERREDLAANGHFVAARELVDNYLAFFPNDADVRAFRERLLDVTHNNPKKAQTAYVEARKMRQRLELHGRNANISLLSSDERRTLNELVPYHTELKAALGQVLHIEDGQLREKELLARIRAVKALVSSAKLVAAGAECESLLLANPELPAVKEAYKRIRELRDEADKLVAECSAALVRGDLQQGREKLAQAVKICVDSPEARKFTAGMHDAKGISRVKCSTKTGPLTLTVHFKDRAVIGRPDSGQIPDISIDDRRISRRHAQITLSNNGARIEDLGSTAGTFVSGEKVSAADLADGKTLTLARVFDYAVSLYRDEDGMLKGALFKSAAQAFILVKTSVGFEFDGHDCRLSRNGLVVYRVDDTVWAADGGQVRFFGGADPLYAGGGLMTVEVER